MPKINNKFDFFSSRKLSVIGLALVIVLSLVSPISAQSLNQGYTSDEPLQKGMLVTEKNDDPSKVIAVKQETLDKLKGVVVQQNDSPVTLASEGQNVFVATTGEYEVLVSDENGQIKKGDYISISSLAGVAMKANEEQGIVVGRASADFKGESDSVGSTVDSKTNKTVKFGRIPVAIAIARNPWLQTPKSNSIPKLLERVSVSVAGKPVNTARIWLATAIFLGTAFVVGTMLYSGARSSLISVGRNPLSRGAILRGLVQIVVLSLIVFICGMFGVYLLLKL